MAIRKESLSSSLLLILEKAVDGFVRIEDFGRHGHLYAYERPLRKSDVAQALRRLRERGLIKETNNKTGEIILKLTDEGRDIIHGNNWDEKKWDGKWRIVIWDIPEEKRVIRNLFRRNLKKWGFENMQKSVWVSKRDVYLKLEEYIKSLGIERWVTVIESNKITNLHK